MEHCLEVQRLRRRLSQLVAERDKFHNELGAQTETARTQANHIMLLQRTTARLRAELEESRTRSIASADKAFERWEQIEQLAATTERLRKHLNRALGRARELEAANREHRTWGLGSMSNLTLHKNDKKL